MEKKPARLNTYEVVDEVASLMPQIYINFQVLRLGREPMTTPRGGQEPGKGNTLARALWVTSQGQQKEGAAQGRTLQEESQ